MTTNTEQDGNDDSVQYTGRMAYMLTPERKRFLERKAKARNQKMSEYLRLREERIVQAEKSCNIKIN